MSFKVYYLDPLKVEATINAKILQQERLKKARITRAIAIFIKWKKDPKRFQIRPPTPYCIRKIYDAFIERERNYYSQVRIVKLGRSKYVLVYDDKNPHNGTGPFKTIARAKSWFYNQGR